MVPEGVGSVANVDSDGFWRGVQVSIGSRRGQQTGFKHPARMGYERTLSGERQAD